MSQIDFAIQKYTNLKLEMEQHEHKEPIGLQYGKEEKYYWSQLFHQILEELRMAECNLKKLLDEQLYEYMSSVNQWDKKEACRLLKKHLEPKFVASINELFLYVGRSVMCIPDEYKKKVINDFAHTLEEWTNIDIDLIRKAVQNIGTKMDERCYHCNDLMPEFEGTGQPVCSNCT